MYDLQYMAYLCEHEARMARREKRDRQNRRLGVTDATGKRRTGREGPAFSGSGTPPVRSALHSG